MRAERLNKEKSEHVRIRKENEKKRLLEAQREATLGKIQKVKEELFASKQTETTRRTNPEAGGGLTAFGVVPKKGTTLETRVSTRKKKREEEVEEERGGRVGERNPFARGNDKGAPLKKAKRGGGKKGKK